MKKRLLSLALLLALLISLPGLVMPASAISAGDVQAKMDEYMNFINDYAAKGNAKYVYWNAGIRDKNSTNTLMAAADRKDWAVGLTYSKCVGKGITHLHGTKVNGKQGCTSNIFSGAAQCHGFAKYFCYVLYQSVPDITNKNGSTSSWRCYKLVKGDDSSAYPGIQTGDFLRYWRYNSEGNKIIHSAVVYSVQNGKVTVIDCNQHDNPCVIAKHKSWFPPDNTDAESAFKTMYNDGRAYICRYKGISGGSSSSSSGGTTTPTTPTTPATKTTMTVTSVNTNGVAPAHTGPAGKDKITRNYKLGDTVVAVKSVVNSSNNLWYQLDNGSWLYSKYLTKGTTTPAAPTTPTTPTTPAEPAHTSHDYDTVGKCKVCGAQFPLSVSSVSKTMQVTSVNSSGTAPAHSTPYGDATITKRYNKGDKVTVTGQAKNAFGNLWYQLSDNSWLVASYLSEVSSSSSTANTRTGVVHVPSGSNGLAINDKPAASPKNSKQLGVIPPGGTCTVYPDKTSGKWYWVEYNGVKGYAHSNYITLK